MVLKGEAAWICLMCCNADVLFSVLVLHWVTSKDSSSTSSTARSGYGTRSAYTSKAGNTTNKLERFGYGTGSRSAGKSTGVTTHISALRPGKGDEDEEIQMVDRGAAHGEDRKGQPMGRITVQVEQVVEIEREDGNGRGSDASTTNSEDLSRGRTNKSTEDLVE
jgi:hypothetical protein